MVPIGRNGLTRQKLPHAVPFDLPAIDRAPKVAVPGVSAPFLLLRGSDNASAWYQSPGDRGGVPSHSALRLTKPLSLTEALFRDNDARNTSRDARRR